MNEHFARVIANMAVFLEFTDESLLNEDAAVEAMEQLASELQCMPATTRRELAAALLSVAASYEDKREFVTGLPETLGIS